MRLVKNITMFIQRAPDVTFACTFKKTLFTRAAFDHYLDSNGINLYH